jgi:hypothetical protein
MKSCVRIGTISVGLQAPDKNAYPAPDIINVRS